MSAGARASLVLLLLAAALGHARAEPAGAWQLASEARSESRLGLAWQRQGADEAETRWQQRLSASRDGELRGLLELEGLWRSRGVAEGRLGQAYYQQREGDWQWRVGRQIYAWNVTDTVSPSDLLNPRDWRDPSRPRKLALPSLSLRHDPGEGRTMELVLSPGAPASQLPDGLWRAALAPGPALLPVQHPAQQAQWAGRLSANGLGGFNSLVLYHGHNPSPTAEWQAGAQGTTVLAPRQERLDALSLGHVRELDASSLLRLEWGRQRARRGDSFSQWVAALEHSLDGPGDGSLRLVLQWQGEYAVQRSVDTVPGWWDFRRLFNHQMLARLQQQSDDAQAWNWSLEGSWQPGTGQQLWRLETRRRLTPHAELSLGATAIHGPEGSFWGQYRQQSRWTLGLLWRP